MATESIGSTTSHYVPDVLGGEFVARELALASSAREAEIVATLIRLGTPTRKTGVLYLHGFSDYFFQAHHAQYWAERGYDFYALDLRRYGRSLRPHQHAGETRDLTEYHEEVARAIAIMREEGHDRIVLLGHSTGGLIATLFAQHHPGAIDVLVLNSPWYDINDSPLKRRISAPLASLVALRSPDYQIARMPGVYTESIHASTGGAWDFDLTMKPLAGFPVRAAWLAAIRRAQREVNGGLNLRMPVLLCTSTRSGGTGGKRATPVQLRTTDTVLDVRHMWHAATRIGPDVTIRTVPGGLHDLALSAPTAREDYETAVTTWLERRLGTPQ